MFNVYNDHRGMHSRLPPYRNLDEIRMLAECTAALGYDAFYRVFEQKEEGGEQFVTAYSVLNGVVTEHPDVTIPNEHW